VFKAIGLDKLLVFVQQELKAITCEAKQWYAMAGDMDLGKPNNGRWLSVYR